MALIKVEIWYYSAPPSQGGGQPGHPDQGLPPGQSGKPDQGLPKPPGSPDQGLPKPPGSVAPPIQLPPEIWPPIHPSIPGGPVDPGFGNRPPTDPGYDRPSGGHPDQGLPGERPPHASGQPVPPGEQPPKPDQGLPPTPQPKK